MRVIFPNYSERQTNDKILMSKIFPNTQCYETQNIHTQLSLHPKQKILLFIRNRKDS